MSLGEYLSLLREWAPALVAGTLQMLRMASLAYVLAAILAVPLAAARMSRNAVLASCARIYIDIARGTPLLTQLFVIYYVLPSIGITIRAFEAAVLGISLYYAAYMAQTYRAGVEAVDAGQREAAQAIGLERRQWFPSIILPQAVPVIIPPAANYLIWIIQDTSIASLISAPELMLAAKEISAEYFTPLEIYVTVAAIYLAVGYVLSTVMVMVSRKLHSQNKVAEKLRHFYW